MKKLHFLFFLLSVFFLSSCNVTENITINPDGTGNFSVNMDASALMGMLPQDSLKTEKVIDSTFNFKELFSQKKDSIAKLSLKEQEELKKLENFSMHMKIDPADKKFTFSIATDFKNVNELQDAMASANTIQNISKNNKTDNPLAGATNFGNNNSSLKYTYNGKKFTRKATMTKKEKTQEETEAADAYKMIYDASSYTVKYNFPKPVKKVFNPSALFSQDKKTVTLTYTFNEYMNNPEKLNFEVEFEK